MEEEKSLTLEHFGQALKLRRRELKLTQEQLAEKANLAWGYLGEIERGKKVPSLTTTLALTKALNVSLEHLLNPPYHYRVNEQVHPYLAQKVSPKINRTTNSSEELLKFYHLFCKTLAAAALIEEEILRNALISPLIGLGTCYFKAYETNNFKKLHREIAILDENFRKTLATLEDEKLAHRLLSSINQLLILLKSLKSELSESPFLK